jgi:hypothetical protein
MGRKKYWSVRATGACEPAAPTARKKAATDSIPMTALTSLICCREQSPVTRPTDALSQW